MRKTKGSVTVFTRGKFLVIRLPRKAFNGTQKILSLGLVDNLENRKIGETIALKIMMDLNSGNFDSSLDKYRVQPIVREVRSYKLAEIFSNYMKYKEGKLEKSSLKNLMAVANILKRCPHKSLDDAKKIYKWLLDNLTQESARRTLTQINAACNWAKSRGEVQHNPFSKMPKIKKVKSHEIEPFSLEERDLIIRGFHESFHFKHYCHFVEFLFLTGCRPSEAVALTWRDVDLSDGRITFSGAIVEGDRKGTKTGKTRIFPINEKLKEKLPPLNSSHQLLFPSPLGVAIDTQNFSRRAWKGTLEDLGIRYRKLYNTRHTFITCCLYAGVPVNQIASWVGNSSKVILEHYAGLMPSEVPIF